MNLEWFLKAAGWEPACGEGDYWTRPGRGEYIPATDAAEILLVELRTLRRDHALVLALAVEACRLRTEYNRRVDELDGLRDAVARATCDPPFAAGRCEDGGR